MYKPRNGNENTLRIIMYYCPMLTTSFLKTNPRTPAAISNTTSTTTLNMYWGRGRGRRGGGEGEEVRGRRERREREEVRREEGRGREAVGG